MVMVAGEASPKSVGQATGGMGWNSQGQAEVTVPE